MSDILKINGVGDGNQSKKINEVIEKVNANSESRYKFISDSTYEISDSDHKKILVFSAATPTVSVDSSANGIIECCVIQDGSGALTFSGITKAVNTTISDQYGWATVVRDANGDWRIAGGS
jgi:hypothetical protein